MFNFFFTVLTKNKELFFFIYTQETSAKQVCSNPCCTTARKRIENPCSTIS